MNSILRFYPHLFLIVLVFQAFLIWPSIKQIEEMEARKEGDGWREEAARGIFLAFILFTIFIVVRGPD